LTEGAERFFGRVMIPATAPNALLPGSQVCTNKTDGGLGLKNLELQNHCLLKFVDKLFTGVQTPWRDWLLTNDSIFSDTPSTSLEDHW
jgi:hypothetical protein